MKYIIHSPPGAKGNLGCVILDLMLGGNLSTTKIVNQNSHNVRVDAPYKWNFDVDLGTYNIAAFINNLLNDWSTIKNIELSTLNYKQGDDNFKKFNKILDKYDSLYSNAIVPTHLEYKILDVFQNKWNNNTMHLYVYISNDTEASEILANQLVKYWSPRHLTELNNGIPYKDTHWNKNIWKDMHKTFGEVHPQNLTKDQFSKFLNYQNFTHRYRKFNNNVIPQVSYSEYSNNPIGIIKDRFQIKHFNENKVNEFLLNYNKEQYRIKEWLTKLK